MLDKILAHKREELKNLRLLNTKRTKPVLNFCASLRKKPVIAEVKKASPSLGDINVTADPVKQAKDYERLGAGAVSVLCDEKFFKGSIYDLAEVAKNISLPVLCKDFILDERQIINAYNAGADCVLLMASALGKAEMMPLAAKARELGLEVLFEVHALDEIETVTACSPKLLGVNNRNLKTLEIDMGYGSEMLKILAMQEEYLLVAESGMRTPMDVIFMKDAGAKAFLIGSGLMGAGDLDELFKVILEAACS
jgi:indole-3-glycerol phosphate synthase